MSISDGVLETQLRERALALGATYFGVADLVPARQFVTAEDRDFLADYPVGVSVGIALADGVVDQLWQHSNGDVGRTYRHHIYSFVSGQLELIAGTLALQIERSGHRAIPVPASGPYDESSLRGLVSHKLVAHLAGLGWIGKNCLLITKAHGPRARWVTVLTDAPLAGVREALAGGDRCKSCSLCVDLCPTQAFTGIPFDPGEPVEARFARQKCNEYMRERGTIYGARMCGICVYVCPHGWSMKRKKNGRRTTPGLLREQLAGIASAGRHHAVSDDPADVTSSLE